MKRAASRDFAELTTKRVFTQFGQYFSTGDLDDLCKDDNGFASNGTETVKTLLSEKQ